MIVIAITLFLFGSVLLPLGYLLATRFRGRRRRALLIGLGLQLLASLVVVAWMYWCRSAGYYHWSAVMIYNLPVNVLFTIGYLVILCRPRSKAPAAAGQLPRNWRRLLTMLALLVALLWWPGVRLLYFGLITFIGAPIRHTDFSQLARVLPPSDATLTCIYRGLPHQQETGDLFRELFTTANRSIEGYRFYSTPIAVSAELRQALTTAMQAPVLYQAYRGPKLCGGYHPDYCFEWHSSQGVVYSLLCAGCHEIIIIGGGTDLHCDLNGKPGEELGKQLHELR